MSMAHANNFVENFFEDAEFLKTVMKKRGFDETTDKSENAENIRIVNVANDIGFKFDLEEYQEACKNYMNELGGWEAAKKIFRMLNTVSKLVKENNDI